MKHRFFDFLPVHSDVVFAAVHNVSAGERRCCLDYLCWCEAKQFKCERTDTQRALVVSLGCEGK